MPYDYTDWHELTPDDPPSNQFVLIGTTRSFPMVGRRCHYLKDGREFLTDEFYIPANGNRIRQLKSRPIYWLPIKGGLKCEE